MTNPYLGEIMMFGGNFAIRAWANCDGQLLPINQYSALFSLLGTTYGGDGRTTFGLPDMRGRVPIHPGNGPGLSPYQQGPGGGIEHTTLSVLNMPSHNHSVTATLRGSAADGVLNTPGGLVLAKSPDNMYGATADTDMGATGIHVTQLSQGANQSFSNVQPWCSVRFEIALQGVFPSRS